MGIVKPIFAAHDYQDIFETPFHIQSIFLKLVRDDLSNEKPVFINAFTRENGIV